jgi:hypothetical protein
LKWILGRVLKMVKYGCIKCGAELYELYPPDDVYTVAKRFREKEEEAIKIEITCAKCRLKNTIFWVRK